MRNRIQIVLVVLLAIGALSLPAMVLQADEVATPGITELSFLVDFVFEIIDVVLSAVSPSETGTELPEFGGGIEPVGNESPEPEGVPDFGGQIEPVG